MKKLKQCPKLQGSNHTQKNEEIITRLVCFIQWSILN